MDNTCTVVHTRIRVARMRDLWSKQHCM